jgi:anaerobic magnesium-protoporphyrin IX monomethyl ester cyclase
MHVVLWDTRKLDVSKDFAGGFGVGQYQGHDGVRGKIIRRFFTRDRRPTALLFAYLAAIFRRLGHSVQYVEDTDAAAADLYVFYPSLITLELERQAMAALLARDPAAHVLVVGQVASVMPEAFAKLPVTVVKGEAEQLLWKLDEVLTRPGAVVQLGSIEDLDLLPSPDWSPFRPRQFRIGYDFWRFPTALVQASRGCTFRCNYCPYIIPDNTVRFRNPEAVVDEIARGVGQWGFRSFKFRDPLFGLSRPQVFRLVELLGRLRQPIQFSIETRIELVPPEVLRALKRVGLTSITVGVERPEAETLNRYHRATVSDDRQHQFIATCRELGIRTVAGFLIGFPDDTEQSVRNVLHYARTLNPTFANFNVVTPYPGTEFYEQIKDRIAEPDFSQYTVYTPVLRYEHLSTQRLRELHAKCFNHFYFRWQYLRDNAHLLWPILQRVGLGRRTPLLADAQPAHPGVPKPQSGLELLNRRGFRSDRAHRKSSKPNPASERPKTE